VLSDLSLVTVGSWLLTRLYQLDKQMMNELLFFHSVVSLSCLVTEPILFYMYKITAGTEVRDQQSNWPQGVRSNYI